MQAAPNPVPDMELTEDGLRYEGTIFSECSKAQEIRASTRMGVAMNPTLRILLIKDGNDLDKKNRALIGTIAEEADAQFWIELVEEKPRAGEIFLEDGMVKEAETVEA